MISSVDKQLRAFSMKLQRLPPGLARSQASKAIQRLSQRGYGSRTAARRQGVPEIRISNHMAAAFDASIHHGPIRERRIGMRSGSPYAGRPAPFSGKEGSLCARFSS